MTSILERDEPPRASTSPTLSPTSSASPSATASPTASANASPTSRSSASPVQPRWWREVLVVAAFYAVYSFVRGQFGSASLSTAEAAANAAQIIDLERALGIYNEAAVQQWFLAMPSVVRSINVFYGLFHFVAPIAVLVLLYRRAPAHYRRSRNTLAATTAIALIGFCLYPLMPPRLLCECPLGSGTDHGYVDTLTQYGGLWSFGSHGVGAVSNQYAAMPSLHFAWALYCAVSITPLLRRRWARALAAWYPALTLLAIIVTANHFWLDAVGGAVVYGAGAALVSGISRLSRTRSRNRENTVDACEDSVQRIAPAEVEAVP